MKPGVEPLRKVVGRRRDERNLPYDVLSCGHVKLMARHILDGEMHYESLPRRRCSECGRLAVAEVAAVLSGSER